MPAPRFPALLLAAVAAPSVAQGTEPGAPTPTAPPSQLAQSDRAYGLDEIVVSGRRRQAVSTVAGLGAPLREVPVTVNVIDRDLIEDLDAGRFRDLFNYVPGVAATETNGGTGDSIIIRGFQTTRRFHLNGLRRALNYDNQTFDLALVERIEIVKGPAGLEFGVVDPGGSVNFVTRKPQAEFAGTATATLASYNRRDVVFDATGPLALDGLAFRFIGHAMESGSFRDTLDSDRVTIAPSLSYTYGEGNVVLLELSYSRQDLPYDRGTFYLEGVGFEDGFAPVERSFHEPGDSLDSQILRAAVYWTQQITDGLVLNAAIDYTEDSFLSLGARNPNLNGLYRPGTNRSNGTRLVRRTFTRFENDRYGYTTQLDVRGDVSFDAVAVTAQAGIVHNLYDETNRGQDGQTTWDIDAFAPVYGTAPVTIGTVNTIGRDFVSETEITETGLFAQATVDFWERVRILGGVRRDRFEDENVYRDNINIPARAAPSVTRLEDDNVSWRLGGSVDLATDVTAFAGYSRAFQPQSGTDRAGQTFAALEATSWEGGIKAERLFGWLTGSASVFEIVQANIAEPDPNNRPGESFRSLLGEVTVRGAELELRAAPTDRIELSAGLAYLDTEITRNLRGQQGNRFFNTPEWQASGRAEVDWADQVPGLSSWLGVVYVDERFGSNANNFVLPSYTRVDLGARFDWEFVALRGRVENLFDERYFLGSQNRPQNIAPGAPRTVSVSLSARF